MTDSIKRYLNAYCDSNMIYACCLLIKFMMESAFSKLILADLKHFVTAVFILRVHEYFKPKKIMSGIKAVTFVHTVTAAC